MYFDDIILFSPSVKGLQNFINVCYGIVPLIALLLTKLKQYVCMLYLTKLNGHIICNYLSDDNGMFKKLRSLYCKANTLLRRFVQCSEKI